jgi:hypothetical protein
MNRTMLAILLLFMPMGSPAYAKPLVVQDWSQPYSVKRWQGLDEKDRIDSVENYMKLAPSSARFGKPFEYKIRACLDKEVTDPDYQSIRVPLMLLMSYCMMKYNSIFEMRRFSE